MKLRLVIISQSIFCFAVFGCKLTKHQAPERVSSIYVIDSGITYSEMLTYKTGSRIPYTGIVYFETRYSINDKQFDYIDAEMDYIKGIPTQRRTYYSNGKVHEIEYMSPDTTEFLDYIEYYPKRHRIKSKGKYRNGYKECTWLHFDEKGRLNQTIDYVRDSIVAKKNTQN
jgi:antitoxin component YwqK of YwqJK toxin-antitoxin module